MAAARHLRDVRGAEGVAAAPGGADDLARGHKGFLLRQLGGFAEADVARAAAGRAVIHGVAEEVADAGEQHAVRGQAVAPGAPRLLLVVLERVRQVGVHEEAHVGAVDPMPKAIVATTTCSRSLTKSSSGTSPSSSGCARRPVSVMEEEVALILVGE